MAVQESSERFTPPSVAAAAARPGAAGAARGGAGGRRPYIAAIEWPEEDEEYRYEAISEQNAQAVNDFFQVAFPVQRDLAGFRWKFLEPPEGPALGMVAIEKATGRVVASAAGRPRRLWIGGREERVVQVFETATAPDRHLLKLFRGVVGGFSMMAVEQGLPLAFGGKIGRRALAVGKRVYGFQVYLQLRTWELRLSLRQAMRHRLGPASSPLSWRADRLRPARRPKERDGYQMEAAAAFDAEVDELWLRLRERYPVACVRESEALNHRYRDCPVGEHRVWLARREGQLVGYLVYRVWERDGVRLATVLDYLDGRQAPVTRALVSQAAEDAAARGCDFLHLACAEGGPADQVLEAMPGFRVSDREELDTVAGNLFPLEDPQDPELAHWALAFEPSNWHYAQGDSDFGD